MRGIVKIIWKFVIIITIMFFRTYAYSITTYVVYSRVLTNEVNYKEWIGIALKSSSKYNFILRVDFNLLIPIKDYQSMIFKDYQFIPYIDFDIYLDDSYNQNISFITSFFINKNSNNKFYLASFLGIGYEYNISSYINLRIRFIKRFLLCENLSDLKNFFKTPSAIEVGIGLNM